MYVMSRTHRHTAFFLVFNNNNDNNNNIAFPYILALVLHGTGNIPAFEVVALQAILVMLLLTMCNNITSMA